MNKNLKLIALIPPEPVYAEIKKQQEYIALTWGPKHALRTPPHITIIPPIMLTHEEVGWLYGISHAIAGSVQSFSVELKGYSSFKPRVIFIEPQLSSSLSALHSIWHESIMTKMPHVLAKYPDRPYHPHLTLAHKDVTHQQFDAMWQYFSKKKYQASFIVNKFCILTHTSEGWIPEQEYLLA